MSATKLFLIPLILFFPVEALAAKDCGKQAGTIAVPENRPASKQKLIPKKIHEIKDQKTREAYGLSEAEKIFYVELYTEKKFLRAWNVIVNAADCSMVRAEPFEQ